MKFIEFLAVRFWVFIFFLLVSTPLFAVLAIVAYAVEKREHLHFIQVIVALVGLVWLAGIGWMVQQTATQIVFQKKSFNHAIHASWCDARLRLAFVPILGRLFIRRHDDDDDDNNAD